ncbi:pentraxin fusion protein-like [Palaemon carinicauda]|uniref:pentraxin fusion protein-like n=1 Tax=Palaemon carinicauda TaxID=392227 RepID=UPI0035B63442
MPSPDMLHDIAPGKMTYASSVYEDASGPEYVIDGNDNSLFHSKQEERPWWMIDLGSERVIYHIMILSRQDRWAGRLQDLEIRLGSSKQTTGDFSSYGLLYLFKGPYRQEDGYLMYTFIHGVKGRYLSLQMVKGQLDFLQLNTVKVIALRN